MQCAYCASEKVVKNGVSRHGHQRWLCRVCNRTCGEKNHRQIEPAKRAEALAHYLEGEGLHATERLAGVSHNTVMNWVMEEVSEQVLAQVPPEAVEWVDADKLGAYVPHKKKLAVCGGLLIMITRRTAAKRWGIVTPPRSSAWIEDVTGQMLAQVSSEAVKWVEAGELWKSVAREKKVAVRGGLLILLRRTSAAGRWGIVVPPRPSAWMRNLLRPRTSDSARSSGRPTVGTSPPIDTSKAKLTRSP